MTSSSVATYHKNLKFIDFLLKKLNQGILNADPSKSRLERIVLHWPIGYVAAWSLFYIYLIVAQTADMEVLSEQLYSFMSILQALAKLVNGGVFQRDTLKELLQWCEDTYEAEAKTDYREIITNGLARANLNISRLTR